MTDTTAIVLSIIGAGVAASALLVTVIVFAWTNISEPLDELKGDMNHMNRQFGEANKRLDRVETRIDAIGRNIADLRDRTGTLEGTLSTFMNEGRSPNAA